jgi:hypothetical protein
MSCKCEKWEAFADSMPGPDGEKRRLRVTGDCMCTSTGHRLRLAYGNPGINPDPEVIILNLTVQEPDGGGDVMTREAVRFEDEIGPRPKRVHVRTPGEDDVTIQIQDVS